MSTAPVERLDRRHRRRQEAIEEAIEEAIDAAVAVMGEQGAAGLSLGEVARRMGIRTPSLYVYFVAKNALYDAVFARGWRRLGAVMEQTYGRLDQVDDLPAFLLSGGETFVRWSLENPAYSELMIWRPVPGYEPSPEAYEPAVQVFDRGSTMFAELKDRGLFRPDIDIDEAMRMWTVLVSGVITQQLANAPQESYDDGRFTTLMPGLVELFHMRYGAKRRPRPRRPS
jgi:AcrR family transcriptional regulator